MIEAKYLHLSEDQRQTWAQAGSLFPGEKLSEVVLYALDEAAPWGDAKGVYEIRRSDAPGAFDALLKLQKDDAASRNVRVEGEDFWEILLVEAWLFEQIMLIVAKLIESMLQLMGGGAGSPPAGPAKRKAEYVPTWKRQALIGHDDGYTP